MVRIPTTSGWFSNQRLGFQPVVGNPPMVGEFPTIYLSWPWCSGGFVSETIYAKQTLFEKNSGSGCVRIDISCIERDLQSHWSAKMSHGRRLDLKWPLGQTDSVRQIVATVRYFILWGNKLLPQLKWTPARTEASPEKWLAGRSQADAPSSESLQDHKDEKDHMENNGDLWTVELVMAGN